MRRSTIRMHYRPSFARHWESTLSGDFEDPRKRGILRNTSCRSYRQQLESTEQANIVQGLLIVTGLATVLAVFWFHSVEPIKGDDLSQVSAEIGTLEALWLGVSGILGLGSQEPVADEKTTRAFHCNQRLDSLRMFRRIGKQVLNQEQALARLERAVMSDRPLKTVALLGPPGVGKSLTAMALRQQFPWPENVHTYSWSTYVPDGAHKFHMIRNFVDQLSNCGQNLLIIDNLCPCDYSIVSIYNKLLQEREGDPTVAATQTVLVVYIFNLDLEHYWQQYELLQQLPTDTTLINYRAFGRAELLDCLDNELRLEQRTLNRRTFSCILEEALLDVEETGCKRIPQLLMKYGQPDHN